MRKKKDWSGQEKINDPNINYGSWNKDWDNINKWYTTQIMPEHRQDWQNGGGGGGGNWPWQNGGQYNNGQFNYGFNGCCTKFVFHAFSINLRISLILFSFQVSSPCLNDGVSYY